MLGRAILKPLASIVIGQEAIGRLSPSGEGRSGDASCPEHRTGKDRLCEAIPSARRASPVRRDRSCHSGEGSRCRSRLPTRYVRLRGMPPYATSSLVASQALYRPRPVNSRRAPHSSRMPYGVAITRSIARRWAGSSESVEEHRFATLTRLDTCLQVGTNAGSRVPARRNERHLGR